MKLLASDLPMESGQDQRLFLVGDEQEYKVCGGLISELRDTILEAMTTRVHEAEDERRDREEAENLEKKTSYINCNKASDGRTTWTY